MHTVCALVPGVQTCAFPIWRSTCFPVTRARPATRCRTSAKPPSGNRRATCNWSSPGTSSDLLPWAARMSGRPFFRLCAGAGCPRRERRTACMQYARAHLPMIALVLLPALPAMVSAQVVDAGPVGTTALDQAFADTVARHHLPALTVGLAAADED